jgi:hypothetical protein
MIAPGDSFRIVRASHWGCGRLWRCSGLPALRILGSDGHALEWRSGELVAFVALDWRGREVSHVVPVEWCELARGPGGKAGRGYPRPGGSGTPGVRTRDKGETATASPPHGEHGGEE